MKEFQNIKSDFNDYYIVKLDESRIKDLVYLFDGVYGLKYTEEDVGNKHLFCHGGNKFIGFIAYHKETNEPSAFYGVFPVYIVDDGKITLVAQSGDTMTHPKHQKKGLFIQLAKITFNFCTSIGIHLIFGFPNTNSYPGFIKYLEFSELPPLKNIEFLENKFEICRITSKNKWLLCLHDKYIKFIIAFLSKKGNSFPNSNALNDFPYAHILHDEEYYRLKKKKDKMLINIRGVDIWIKISSNLIFVGDINLKDSSQAFAIIKRLKLMTRISGCRFLSFAGSPNSYLISVFDKMNFRSSEYLKVILLNLSSSIPIKKFSFLGSDIDVY